jgi:hypothetical protein
MVQHTRFKSSFDRVDRIADKKRRCDHEQIADDHRTDTPEQGTFVLCEVGTETQE